MSIQSTVIFVFNNIIENDEKIFKWKLLNMILPNDVLLYRWKLINSNLCLNCGQTDDYEHYFITCPFYDNLWNHVTIFFKSVGYDKNIRNLTYIVLGYKVKSEAYRDINIIFSLIGFVIYKAYHISERRSHAIDQIRLLTFELYKKTDVKQI